MDLSEAAWWNNSPWLMVLAAAALAFAVWWLRRRPHLPLEGARSDKASSQSTLTYRETPTVRLDASQRIDRLHRVVSLKAGEYIDLLELTFDRIPRLRVDLAGIERPDAAQATIADYARIGIELGGAIAGCGALVKEIGINCFLVPRASQDEHRCSILYFHGQEDVVNFLRIKVVQIYPAEQAADIDVLHVCGHWQR